MCKIGPGGQREREFVARGGFTTGTLEIRNHDEDVEEKSNREDVSANGAIPHKEEASKFVDIL